MIDQANLKIGDKVCYQPVHSKIYAKGEFTNGMVKEIPSHTTDAVRVVYHCNGDWDNFASYVGALTNLGDLEIGWR